MQTQREITWSEVQALVPKGDVEVLTYRNVTAGPLEKIELVGDKVRLFFRWAATCSRGWKMGTPMYDWQSITMDQNFIEFEGNRNIPVLEVVGGEPYRVRFGNDARLLHKESGGTITLRADDHLVDPTKVRSSVPAV